VSLVRRFSSRPSLRGPSSSSAASRRCDDEERRRSRAPPSDTSGSDGTRWARGGAHGFSWREAAAGGLALGSAVAAMVVATAPSPRKAEAGAPPAYTLGGRVAPGEGGTVESSKANDRRGGETAGSPASQRFLVAGARQARQTERERQGQRWCVRTGAVLAIPCVASEAGGWIRKRHEARAVPLALPPARPRGNECRAGRCPRADHVDPTGQRVRANDSELSGDGGPGMSAVDYVARPGDPSWTGSSRRAVRHTAGDSVHL
jgi:hypothetical protein